MLLATERHEASDDVSLGAIVVSEGRNAKEIIHLVIGKKQGMIA